MGIFDLITQVDNLIKDRAAAAVLQERVNLLRDQVEILMKENESLKQQLVELESYRQEAARQLERQRTSAEFVEHRGAFFKRSASGKFIDEAYCPTCAIPMSSLQDALPFRCSQCKRTVNFRGTDLKRIIAEIS